MDDVKKLILEVLEKGYLMSLATVDDAGPWVSDVIFVADDDFTIWWLSKPERRHSLAIAHDPRVAATITISNDPKIDNLGLQICGTAEVVTGDDLARATKHRAKRGKPAPQTLGEVLDPNHLWYRLKPTKIELIHEALFGFEKKVFEL